MNPDPSWQENVNARNQRVGKMAIGVIVGMFLFGFASIPMYRWVCAQVNPGGSSWFNGDPDDYTGVVIDPTRTLNVRFTTNVERVLPWEFYSVENRIEMHPGEKKLVRFVSKNNADYPVKGKAVYDINPAAAGRHYRKIECFCFIEQTLEAGEQVDMPLYFWFDPEIPEHVKEISLAYTFFSAESSMARSIRNRETLAR
ncbi:MAG: cytochrome c oxidase assembly protein [Bradymonadaceae bacterium]